MNENRGGASGACGRRHSVSSTTDADAPPDDAGRVVQPARGPVGHGTHHRELVEVGNPVAQRLLRERVVACGPPLHAGDRQDAAGKPSAAAITTTDAAAARRTAPEYR
jgi:hypothetical protein